MTVTAPATDVRCAIVIVNYNGGDLVAAAVDRRWRRPCAPTRADALPGRGGRQRSTDGSLPRLRAFGERIVLIASPTNTGFAGGNNLAFARLPAGRRVRAAQPRRRRRPRLAGAAARVRRAPPRLGRDRRAHPQRRRARRSSTTSAIASRSTAPCAAAGAASATRASYADERPLLIASGCAMLLDAARAVRQAGGFDERFFCYCDDVELCLRLGLLGYTGWYAPAARVAPPFLSGRRQRLLAVQGVPRRAQPLLGHRPLLPLARGARWRWGPAWCATSGRPSRPRRGRGPGARPGRRDRRRHAGRRARAGSPRCAARPARDLPAPPRRARAAHARRRRVRAPLAARLPADADRRQPRVSAPLRARLCRRSRGRRAGAGRPPPAGSRWTSSPPASRRGPPTGGRPCRAGWRRDPSRAARRARARATGRARAAARRRPPGWPARGGSRSVCRSCRRIDSVTRVSSSRSSAPSAASGHSCQLIVPCALPSVSCPCTQTWPSSPNEPSLGRSSMTAERRSSSGNCRP